MNEIRSSRAPAIRVDHPWRSGSRGFWVERGNPERLSSEFTVAASTHSDYHSAPVLVVLSAGLPPQGSGGAQPPVACNGAAALARDTSCFCSATTRWWGRRCGAPMAGPKRPPLPVAQGWLEPCCGAAPSAMGPRQGGDQLERGATGAAGQSERPAPVDGGARSVLRIDLRAESGGVSAAEEIQSGIELRKMRIDFGSVVRSN